MLCLMIAAFGGCSAAKNDRADIPATSLSADAVAGNDVPSPTFSDARASGNRRFEPALSEDDIRAGKAVKALVMMRYVGFRDGTHTLLIVGEDDPGVVGRVTTASSRQRGKVAKSDDVDTRDE